MKKLLLIIFIPVLIFAGDKKNVQQKNISGNFEASSPASVSADSLVIWSEDWEGEINWTSIDETIGSYWHPDTTNAYNGVSWWMADTVLRGYDNHWYQVLDTDTFLIPDLTAPSLTFYHRYKVEAAGGEPTGYNGWDGMNVRISTDSGATWTILQNPAPAYTSSSLYSFGDDHGEGQGVPGWGGALNAWTKVTFDLTSYTAKSVIIRFAFASDPGYSTPDDLTMFGWQVDDIVVANGTDTLYSNSGDTDNIFPKSNLPVGGDLWRISSGTNLPSGTHFAEVNDTAKNTYNTNMINSLVSEYFFIPDTSTTAYVDFYVKGNFVDTGDDDNWTVQFQKQGEFAWRYISNITQSPNADNFVYVDAPLNWARFSQVYSSGLVNLAPLRGDSIRVRIQWSSDNDEPLARAVQIDKFVVFSPVTTTGIEERNSQPKQFSMEQNYPNPFNPATSVKFSLPSKSDVVIKLYNILGSEIMDLANGTFDSGEHTIKFNAAGLNSGVYFYSIKAVGENGKVFTQTKKLTLLK